MRRFLKWFLAPLYKRYRGLQDRLTELEHRAGVLTRAVECLIDSPRWNAAAGLNGQEVRKKILAALLQAIRFDVVLETGTFIGDSAGYLASVSGLPVETCEIEHLFCALARRRLEGWPHVTVTNGDSMRFLQSAAERHGPETTVFAYLDAHWYVDLPLRSEIQFIAEHWKRCVIMIDDFQVPGDGGYGFDDYGPGKRLDRDLIVPLISRYGLAELYPADGSEQETGARRGCVVLTPADTFGSTLASLPSLRRYGP